MFLYIHINLCLNSQNKTELKNGQEIKFFKEIMKSLFPQKGVPFRQISEENLFKLVHLTEIQRNKLNKHNYGCVSSGLLNQFFSI